MRNPWEQITPSSEAEGQEEIPPETFEVEAPETILEQRQEIVEAAQEKRRHLLKDIFTSRTADIAGNFIPGVDIPKMTIEAAIGKTVSGEKLSARQRFDYMAMAGGITLAYALEFAGMMGEAMTARSAIAVMSKMEFGPELLKEAGGRARSKFPKAANLLEKTGEFLAEKRDVAMKRFGEELRKGFLSLQPEMFLR